MRRILLPLFAIGALLLAPDLALATDPIDRPIFTLGTGAAVACTNPAAVLDDASVANTIDRWIVVANPSTNTVTVRIGGASAGANAAGLEPGQSVALFIAANTVIKCYAASSTTVQVTEMK